MPAIPKIRIGTNQWVLIAAILGSSIVFLDSNVVNVALPVLQSDFGATSADVQWVVEAYALFLSTLLLVGGALGDRLGQRRMFMIGIAVFALASAWCAASGNIQQLIFARAVQGIGGALLTPGSLALITETYSAEERGSAIGTWSGFTTITAALGPLVGGWLIQAATWRWIFLLNLPLSILALLICVRFVPESRIVKPDGPIDFAGAALATFGLGGVVYGLTFASINGFGSINVSFTIITGIALLVGFIVVEMRQKAPMMPLFLFNNRTFSGTNLLTFLLYGALGGALYFLPFNLQQIQGYSPFQAGLTLLPFPIIVFSLSRWAGGLIHHFGSRLPLTVGPCIAGVGFLLFARTDIGGNYWVMYFPAVVTLAIGMAITVAPLTTTVMGSVAQTRAGIASGINNAVARTASLMAIAILGIVFAGTFTGALSHQISTLSLDPTTQHAITSQSTKLADTPIPSDLDQAAQHAVKQSIQSAFITSFRVVMLIGAVLAFASAAIARLTITDIPVQRATAIKEGIQKA